MDGDVRAEVVVGVYNHGCVDIGGTLHTRLVASEHTVTVLPPEILLFPMLEKLDLTHNKLRTLPEEIVQLKHLKELKLRGNGLQYLPESIGHCTELREIDLEANCLVGLPDSLANCAQLRSVNLRNNPYSYVRRSFGGWQNVKLMNELPEVLTRLPNLEKLDFDDTMIRKMPGRPFVSKQLKGVVYEDTLLQDVDPEIHPQIPVPQLDKSRRWAAAHVGFWFDSDHVRLDYFYDFKTGNYDFSEMRALLGIVLDCLVPAAAPYDEALEKFKEETADIVRRLLWNEDLGRQHVRLLFENLLDELDRIESGLGAPMLADGVRTVFQKFLGQGV